MQHGKQAGRIIVLQELAEWQYCWNSWDMVSQLAWLEPWSGCVEALQESQGGKRRKVAAPLWKSGLNVWSSDKEQVTGWLRVRGSWSHKRPVWMTTWLDDHATGHQMRVRKEVKVSLNSLKKISDWQTSTQGELLTSAGKAMQQFRQSGRFLGSILYT